MRLLVTVLGILLVLLVALDGFETIVLPRRVTRPIRLARLFYRIMRSGGNWIASLLHPGAWRDSFVAYMGPLSLLGLLLFWAVLFVVGYGAVMWGLALPLNAALHSTSILTYLYLSGTTFFTLGLGDITPGSGAGRFLVVSEAALGFIFLALVISYVPVIYQAFSRRELRISLLDERAGSPPTAVELLVRNLRSGQVDELRHLLRDWEVWCADILESHLSYPILGFYRSQHEQQSWVEALTIILDTCALLLTTVDILPVDTARFSFAMARHTVVDLAQVFGAKPPTDADRLSSTQYSEMRQVLAAAGIPLRESTVSEQRLSELRATYEPFVAALAGYIRVSLPAWYSLAGSLDDWQTSAWDEQFPANHQTLDDLMHASSLWSDPEPEIE